MDNDPDQFWPFGFPPAEWKKLPQRDRLVIEGLVIAEMRRVRGGSGESGSSWIPDDRRNAA